MIKKSIALAAAVTFASALTLAAPKQLPTPFKMGTIATWDAAAKHGVIKDSKGVETRFVWNEKTTLTGTPKVGEHAYLWYKQDKDGKVTATHVNFGTRLAMQKATPRAPQPPAASTEPESAK